MVARVEASLLAAEVGVLLGLLLMLDLLEGQLLVAVGLVQQEGRFEGVRRQVAIQGGGALLEMAQDVAVGEVEVVDATDRALSSFGGQAEEDAREGDRLERVDFLRRGGEEREEGESEKGEKTEKVGKTRDKERGG